MIIKNLMISMTINPINSINLNSTYKNSQIIKILMIFFDIYTNISINLEIDISNSEGGATS